MFEETRKMMELFAELGPRKVLVAGIDVSKNKFTIAAVNGTYEIKIKAKDINLDKKALDKLYKEIDEIVEKEGIKQLIFGCEPSGIYYKPILKELICKYPGAIFKLINPSSTKANRDQRMQREKTDPIDSYAITDLLIRGESYDIDFEDNTFNIIKDYVRELDHLVKEMVRFKNKIHAHTDELYPGLESKSNSFLDSLYGMRFLKVLPEPGTLPQLGLKDWQRLLGTEGYELPKHLAIKLRDKGNTIVVTRHKNFKTLREYVIFLVEGYEQLIIRKKIIEERLEELIDTLDFGRNLKEIKGIQTLTIARIIAYTSNPYRFKSGKQVVSFAGLIPKADQSGKQDKAKILSKKGHKKLRTTLVQAAQQVITSTGYFTAYYNRLVIENRKEPMVAIMATANKLARVIMKMIHTGERFNPPTVKNMEIAKGRISRLTSRELANLKKIKRLDSLTQDINELYQVRV
jgi:transposase